ncbi:MAG: nicotinate (nicotinamide) nucleotide adenylyltransferase [Pseudomonadota bacterium]|nr:nicotinate (nicotinamide) nucleotide adenylyltransferase [Pseudomonadota bacterium]
MAKKRLKKIGIFGGTFNPPHFGHINSVLTVSKRLNLEKIFVVPANKNPLRKTAVEASPEQRLGMTQAAFHDYSDLAEVTDCEIKRKGKSYTIDTIKEIQKKNPGAEVYLICGLDALDRFDKWKDFAAILKKVNLVVTSRPGNQWPTSKEELPKGLQKLCANFMFPDVELKTGKFIFFVPLVDNQASATIIRKKMRLGQKVDNFLPLQVESLIRKDNIYPPLLQKVTNDKKFVNFCAKALEDKKGVLIKAFDLRGLVTAFDFTVIASGTNTRHTMALADGLVEAVKLEYGLQPISIEGNQEGRWVIVDYGGFVVHVFYDYVRQEYRLEDLWRKAKEISLS